MADHLKQQPDRHQLLLEAIRKVRCQKQRPSTERIFAMLVQHWKDVTVDDVCRELDASVKAGLITCVMSKGGASYREISSVHRTAKHQNQPDISEVSEKLMNDLPDLILAALREKGSGCTSQQLEKFVRNKVGDSAAVTSHLLQKVCQKLVKQNHLMKNDDVYTLAAWETPSSPLRKYQADSVNEEDQLSSTTNYPNSKNLSPKQLMCVICRRPEDSSGGEDLITCAECSYTGHPSCMKLSPKLVRTILSTRWQCYACKTCSACVGSGKKIKKPADMLVCDGCDRGFHVECCKPPSLAERASSARWLCMNCQPSASSSCVIEQNKRHYQNSDDTCSFSSDTKSTTVGSVSSAVGSLSSKPRTHLDDSCPSEAVVGSSSDVTKTRPHRVSGDFAATSSSRQSSESSSSPLSDVDCEHQTTGTKKPSVPVVPRGLFDALSTYFLPSAERRSRVSLNALPSLNVATQQPVLPETSGTHSALADTTRQDDSIPWPTSLPRSPQRNWKKARHLPNPNRLSGSNPHAVYTSHSSSNVLANTESKTVTAKSGVKSATTPDKAKSHKSNRASSFDCQHKPSVSEKRPVEDSCAAAVFNTLSNRKESDFLTSSTKSPVDLAENAVLSEPSSVDDSKRKRARRTQLSSLQDSLSSFFSASGERKRTTRYVDNGFAALFDDFTPVKRMRKDRSASLQSRRSSVSEAGSIAALEIPAPRLPAEEDQPSSTKLSKTPILAEPDICEADLNSFQTLLKNQQTQFQMMEHRQKVTISLAGYEFGCRVSTKMFSRDFPTGIGFMCEFCFTVFNSDRTLKRHLVRCSNQLPVGSEVYRSKELSVYEVDGCTELAYCRGLCLLSAIFTSKDDPDRQDVSFCDVSAQTAVFYVLVQNTKSSLRFLGFFSQELKRIQQTCFLHCLLVLPPHQGKGYESLLIDLSYKICVKNGVTGSRSLSLRGDIEDQFTSYWSQTIVQYLDRQDSLSDINVNLISSTTGIDAADVLQTLKSLDVVVSPVIRDTVDVDRDRLEEVLHKKQSVKVLQCDLSRLKVQPCLHTNQSSAMTSTAAARRRANSCAVDSMEALATIVSFNKTTAVSDARKGTAKEGKDDGHQKELDTVINPVKKKRGRPPKVNVVVPEQVRPAGPSPGETISVPPPALIQVDDKMAGDVDVGKVTIRDGKEPKTVDLSDMPTLECRQERDADVLSGDELNRSPSPPTLEQIDPDQCDECVSGGSVAKSPDSPKRNAVVEIEKGNNILDVCNTVILDDEPVDNAGDFVKLTANNEASKVSDDESLSLDKSDIEALETAHGALDSFDELGSSDDEHGSNEDGNILQSSNDVFMGNSSENAFGESMNGEIAQKRITPSSECREIDDLQSLDEQDKGDFESAQGSAKDLDESIKDGSKCKETISGAENESSQSSSQSCSSSESDSDNESSDDDSLSSKSSSTLPRLETIAVCVQQNATSALTVELPKSPTTFSPVVAENDAEMSAVMPRDLCMPDAHLAGVQSGDEKQVMNDALPSDSQKPTEVAGSESKETSGVENCNTPSMQKEEDVLDDDSNIEHFPVSKSSSEVAAPALGSVDLAAYSSTSGHSAQILTSEWNQKVRLPSSPPMFANQSSLPQSVSNSTQPPCAFSEPEHSNRLHPIVRSRECDIMTQSSSSSSKPPVSPQDRHFSVQIPMVTCSGSPFVASEIDNAVSNAAAKPSAAVGRQNLVMCSPSQHSLSTASNVNMVHSGMAKVKSPGGGGNIAAAAMGNMNQASSLGQMPGSETVAGVHSAAYRRSSTGSQQIAHRPMASPGASIPDARMHSPINYFGDFSSQRVTGYMATPQGQITQDNSYLSLVPSGPRAQSVKGSPSNCTELAVASPASGCTLLSPAANTGRTQFNLPCHSPASRVDQSPASAGSSGYGSISAGSVVAGSHQVNFNRPSPSPSGTGVVSHGGNKRSSGGNSKHNLSPMDLGVFSPVSASHTSPAMNVSCMAIPPSCGTPDVVGMPFQFPNNVAVPVTVSSYPSIPSPTPRSLQLLSPTVTSSSAVTGSSSSYRHGSQQASTIGLSQRPGSVQYPHHRPPATIGLLSNYGFPLSASPAPPYSGNSMADVRFATGQSQLEHPPQSPCPPTIRQSRNPPRSTPTSAAAHFMGIHNCSLEKLQQLTNRFNDSELVAPSPLPFDAAAAYSMHGGSAMSMLLGSNIGHVGGGLQEPPVMMGFSGSSTQHGQQQQQQQQASKQSGRRRSAANPASGKMVSSAANELSPPLPYSSVMTAPTSSSSSLPFSSNMPAGYGMLGAFSHSPHPHAHPQARTPSSLDYQHYFAANAAANAAAAAAFFNQGATSQLPVQMMQHLGMRHPPPTHAPPGPTPPPNAVATATTQSFHQQSHHLSRMQGNNSAYMPYGYGHNPTDSFNNMSCR